MVRGGWTAASNAPLQVELRLEEKRRCEAVKDQRKSGIVHNAYLKSYSGWRRSSMREKKSTISSVLTVGEQVLRTEARLQS